MHVKSLFFSTLMSLSIMGWADIRVLPVERTPEPNSVELDLVYPLKNEVKNSSSVKIQFRLMGYPVGTNSDFPRAKEIFNDNEGQSIHVIIDSDPYFAINEAF